jgi:hypothetical protein
MYLCSLLSTMPLPSYLTPLVLHAQAKEIMYHKANINRIMSEYTSQSLSKVELDTDRDRYMSPLEAKEYGVIDHIIGGDSATFRVSVDVAAVGACVPAGSRARVAGWGGIGREYIGNVVSLIRVAREGPHRAWGVVDQGSTGAFLI